MAYTLRMPVYKLIEEMPHDEMARWFHYFERRPIGWRDDLRASYLMQAQGAKIKTTEVFPSLAAVMKRSEASTFVDSFKKSVIFQNIKGAVGGERLDIL